MRESGGDRAEAVKEEGARKKDRKREGERKREGDVKTNKNL